MNTIIQIIGAFCCAIVMGVAALFRMNYLETNIWWFYVVEPLLIVVAMGGCLLSSCKAKKSVIGLVAIGLFCMTTVGTGLLIKMAIDYGENISVQQALSANQWAVNMWNEYVPEMFHADMPTTTSYMDRVGEAGILILRHYGHALWNVGYFELNLILYAFLFPGIALYFAVLWKKRKFVLVNYSAIAVCLGTLLMSFYLFKTLPLINFG